MKYSLAFERGYSHIGGGGSQGGERSYHNLYEKNSIRNSPQKTSQRERNLQSDGITEIKSSHAGGQGIVKASTRGGKRRIEKGCSAEGPLLCAECPARKEKSLFKIGCQV